MHIHTHERRSSSDEIVIVHAGRVTSSRYLLKSGTKSVHNSSINDSYVFPDSVSQSFNFAAVIHDNVSNITTVLEAKEGDKKFDVSGGNNSETYHIVAWYKMAM
jgi:hypothetical protein